MKRLGRSFKRGGRGKNGDQPLMWVPICEMNDDWVLATIDYNTDRGMPVETNWFTNLLHEEMNYRNAKGISIEEENEDPHNSKPDINHIY